MKLWHNKRFPEQKLNLREFERLMAMNSDVSFAHPNEEAAPWHLQAIVNGSQIDVWPHLLKGRIDSEKAVVGYARLQALIARARGGEEEDDQLIED